MSNEDASLWIVYNGEIFNHAELRPPLEQKGHRYRTRCDTETILHAYEQYGSNCLNLFRGMFSFVIWDKVNKKIFAARDRVGKKPFYYSIQNGCLIFASEIKALLKHPDVPVRFRSSVLAEYLTLGYLCTPNTFFEGIEQLPPGHYLEWDLSPNAQNSGPVISRYWNPPFQPEVNSSRSDADWIAECRERLEETVRLRLMSDVPLGVFLSGGVDSSAITALVRAQTKDPLHTFSVGYAEAAYSELPFAATVANHLKTSHHEVRLSRESFFAALPRLIWHEDEPITWPSSVSLHFVSQLASKNVKVVLTGEGSDELFGGYGRYRSYLRDASLASSYALVPASIRTAIRNSIDTSSLLGGDFRRKLQHTILGRDLHMESLYLDNYYSAFTAQQALDLIRPGFAQSPYANILHFWNQNQGPDLLSRMLYTDQKSYLLELLMKQDQMSMSASIESRVPLLDHTFIEFAASIPSRLKIHNGRGKHIFKEAVAGLLPPEIIDRKKMGFPTPLRAWFSMPETQPLLEPLANGSSWISEYLNTDKIVALLDGHRRGTIDATDRLWRLLNLHLWGEIFLKGEPTRPALPTDTAQ